MTPIAVVTDLYELRTDPKGQWLGIFYRGPGRRFRLNCPEDWKKQVREWIAIQKERRRLGLPPLTDEEMEIR